MTIEPGNDTYKEEVGNSSRSISSLLRPLFIRRSPGKTPVADPITIDVWSDFAPGETTKQLGVAGVGSSEYGPIQTLGGANSPDDYVTRPQLCIYRPGNSDSVPRPAIVICPGGGYTLLTTDIEASEIAQWLTTLGYVAVVLTYRVPDAEWSHNDPLHIRALQDAQRSIAVLRTQGTQYGIDTKKIGMIGFSAGGHLVTHTAAINGQRAYTVQDTADSACVRPDFILGIYPAYLLKDPPNDLTIQAELQPTDAMPPFFLAVSRDDTANYWNVSVYAEALRQVGVPTTHHIYETGGHGYGLRAHANQDASTWAIHAANWLAQIAPIPSSTKFVGKLVKIRKRPTSVTRKIHNRR